MSITFEYKGVDGCNQSRYLINTYFKVFKSFYITFKSIIK